MARQFYMIYRRPDGTTVADARSRDDLGEFLGASAGTSAAQAKRRWDRAHVRREHVHVGWARRVRVRQPFRKSAEAWAYPGHGNVLGQRARGAIHFDDGLMLDLETGEVYREVPPRVYERVRSE